MKKKITGIAGDLKRSGLRHILAAAAAPLFFVVLTVVYFVFMTASVKESIISNGEISCVRSANRFDNYLLNGKDSIRNAAYTVDTLMRDKRSSDEILAYMTLQSECMINTVNNDFTGIYGYINGEYLDSSGWVPDDDYVPTERPWYTDALQMNGSLALVEPYVDAKTHTVMITLAQLLSDGKSVVALDISLDTVQKITEEIAESDADTQAMVITDNGIVVAHSDKQELGKNYLEEKGTLGAEAAARIFLMKDSHYEIAFAGQQYIVYSVPIENDWHSVSVISSGNALAPLKILMAVTVIVLTATAAIAGSVFMNIFRKGIAEEKLNFQLSSIADIYMTVFDLNVINDTYSEISTKDPLVSELADDSGNNMREKLYDVTDKLTNELSKESVREFVDIDTLEERLSETNTVTLEFLNHNNLWFRARFIVSERTAAGRLSHVMFTTELIDKEKRDRDKLLYLSETDRMTGVSNRGSGEHKIRVMLSNNEHGMFMLLDADKFKSINDTYGHAVGDKVLMALAYSMQRTFRSVDVVMRLGGDEFAAFIPGVTDIETGRNMTDRLFECIDNVHIPELRERRIAVSVGAAFYLDGDSYPFEELYKRADSCTYISKRHDGNYAAFYGFDSDE